MAVVLVRMVMVVAVVLMVLDWMEQDLEKELVLV